MTYEQEAAATCLLKAFRRCHEAELSAGIFDGRICVWPREIDIQADDNPISKADEVGRTFHIGGMWLDGGAGN